MHKFKVGDKVKILNAPNDFLADTVGTIATVIEQDGQDYLLQTCSSEGDGKWYYHPSRFELLKSVEDVKPRPRKRVHKMSNKQKREILLTTKGKFFTASFIKQDGSERKMNCRMGVHKGLKGGKNSHEKHDEYVTVYDMAARGYRTINLETLKYIKMAGATITFD